MGYNLALMKPTRLRPDKALGLFLVIATLLSGCGSDLWGTYAAPTPSTPTGAVPSRTATPFVDPLATDTPSASLAASPFPLSTTEAAATTLPPSATPAPVSSTSVPGSTINYTSQSGDSLDVVATHFGVQPSEITSAGPLSSTGFINPGTLLFLPNRLSLTPSTPSQPIIPDSELVDSPSAVGFDIAGYVNSAGGELSTFKDYHNPVGTISGAEAVRIISVGSSISPRLLLALIQYYTGWVQGQSKPGLDEKHLFGYSYPSYDPATPTLYQPMRGIGVSGSAIVQT